MAVAQSIGDCQHFSQWILKLAQFPWTWIKIIFKIKKTIKSNYISFSSVGEGNSISRCAENNSRKKPTKKCGKCLNWMKTNKEERFFFFNRATKKATNLLNSSFLVITWVASFSRLTESLITPNKFSLRKWKFFGLNKQQKSLLGTQQKQISRKSKRKKKKKSIRGADDTEKSYS